MKNDYRVLDNGKIEVFFDEIMYDGRAFIVDGVRKVIKVTPNFTSKTFNHSQFERLKLINNRLVKITYPILKQSGIRMVPTGRFFVDFGFWNEKERFIRLKRILGQI